MKANSRCHQNQDDTADPKLSLMAACPFRVGFAHVEDGGDDAGIKACLEYPSSEPLLVQQSLPGNCPNSLFAGSNGPGVSACVPLQQLVATCGLVAAAGLSIAT